MTPVVALWWAVAGCPTAKPVADPPGKPAAGTPGFDQAPPTPSVEALRLNGEGRALYKAQRFADARARYTAALAADPDHLGPALNIATSYAREERFPDAARAAADLVRRAFIPWAREVNEAADLAPLFVRPERRVIEAAVVEGRRSWAHLARQGFPVVVRSRPAVRLTGQGVLVLAPYQEVYAWLPATGRYLPLTAEDGQVLAFARSHDGRRLLYVTGGKLVVDAGRPPALRSLAVRRLELDTMELGPPVPLAGDLQALELGFSTSDEPVVRLYGTERSAPARTFVVTDRLMPAPSAGPSAVVRLGPEGVGALRLSAMVPCAFTATDRRKGDVPAVRISARGGTSFTLATPYGAGLGGLPFPK